jgi:hypothetical protein
MTRGDIGTPGRLRILYTLNRSNGTLGTVGSEMLRGQVWTSRPYRA